MRKCDMVKGAKFEDLEDVLVTWKGQVMRIIEQQRMKLLSNKLKSVVTRRVGQDLYTICCVFCSKNEIR